MKVYIKIGYNDNIILFIFDNVFGNIYIFIFSSSSFHFCSHFNETVEAVCFRLVDGGELVF